MKRGIIWIIIIFFIIILVIASIFFISSYKIRSEGKKANIISYSLLECISECPIEVLEDGETWIGQTCGDGCSGNYNFLHLSADLLKKYEKKVRKLLINSEESANCVNLYNSEKDAEKYKQCLKEALPVLKKKYGL
jgi:hypothetical protein